MTNKEKLLALADDLDSAKHQHSDAIRAVIPEGHRCGPVTVDEDQWNRLEAAGDAEREARAALMPSEQDAINLMFEACLRLKELGWREAIYCPKDGSEFDAIEPGSTGIHRTHYMGEWPDGSWWTAADGDLWPSRPVLYRPTEAEKAEREERIQRFRASLSEGPAQ